MSDVSAQPWPGGAPPTDPAPAPRRSWVVLAVVAALLVGALLSAAVMLVLDRYGEPENRYQISVFLERDATAEQRSGVASALQALESVDGVRFESREQAFQNLKGLYEETPELIKDFRADQMPESFRLTTTGDVFDCAPIARVRELPGVDEIMVIQVPADGQPGAKIGC